MMNPIDVRSQYRLSLARTFGLCLKGIRHRMFRSVLTMMVIVLAVAFFMNLVVDSVLARAVDGGVRTEVELARRSAIAAELWFGRPSPTVQAQRLVAARDGSPERQAYVAVSGFDAKRLADLVESLRGQRAVIDYLNRLDSGSRAMLVRRTGDDQVFTEQGLLDEERWKQFADGVPRVKSKHLPLTIEQVRSLVAQAPATQRELEAFANAWNGRIDHLRESVRQLAGSGDRDPAVAWLAVADANGITAFSAILDSHGFQALHPLARVQELQVDFQREALRERMVAALSSEEGRTRWMESYRTQPSIDDKLLLLGDAKSVTAVGAPFTADEVRQIGDTARHERILLKREDALAGKVAPGGGLLSTRQAFLVAISFVVCMVGIANAMLMAITERFREIATMKCLGATDSFILTQFLMEAGIQGALGGAIGTVVGLLLSLVKGTWLYGGHLWGYFPILGILGSSIACVIAGLVLATLASIYPSWMASRMAPMEAMRVE